MGGGEGYSSGNSWNDNLGGSAHSYTTSNDINITTSITCTVTYTASNAQVCCSSCSRNKN